MFIGTPCTFNLTIEGDNSLDVLSRVTAQHSVYVIMYSVQHTVYVILYSVQHTVYLILYSVQHSVYVILYSVQ